MLNCEKVLASVYEYLDKEAGPKDLASIKEHLDLCRDCFKRVDFEKLLRDHMRSKTNHDCPDTVKKRIRDIMESF